MLSSRAVSSTLVLSLICFNPCSIFGANTITLATPAAGSTWQAGANLTIQGFVTWQLVNPPASSDNPPMTWQAFVRAGGVTGTVTNSTSGTYTNVTNPPVRPGTNDGDFNGNMALTPAAPPIGGSGPSGNATYFIHAQSTFKFPLATTSNQIQVKNG